MNPLFTVLISGFTIGILGSFHCVGMCGPLALSLPVNHLNKTQRIFSILLYNLGRVFTYAIMGICFGFIGKTFAFFKVQQWLSVTAGVLILSILLVHQFGNPNKNYLARYTHRIKAQLSKYLQSEKSLFTLFTIGILNGLLPCGLVYVAIAASLAAGSVMNSGLMMMAFGLGTLPVMALTMAFGKFISLNFRQKLNKITPYFIMLVAVLLILRGLNLGIRYVSPAQEKEKMDCCHEE